MNLEQIFEEARGVIRRAPRRHAHHGGPTLGNHPAKFGEGLCLLRKKPLYRLGGLGGFLKHQGRRVSHVSLSVGS